MRVMIYADFRSPHARGWLAGLKSAGLETHALSSEQFEGLPDVQSPKSRLAAARQKLVDIRSAGGTGSVSRTFTSKSPSESFQTCVALARFLQRRKELASACERFKPDIVHALRLPYEGTTVLSSGLKVPIVISTWGADFHPQAESSKMLAQWIRSGLGRAAGIHYDVREDYERALRYGLPAGIPQLHAAGNFGVDTSLFYAAGTNDPLHVVYPRGRSPLNNPRGFIDAAGLLAQVPGIRFTAVGLKGLDFAEAALESAALKGKLTLTPGMSRDEFAKLMRSAGVIVSPGFSDGMPNSVMEALASGSQVVVGRLPQFEALAQSMSNLLLADPHRPDDIASTVLSALNRSAARGQPIPAEFSFEENVRRVPHFYEAVLNASLPAR